MPISAHNILFSVINGSFVQKFPDFADDLARDVRLQHMVVYQIFKLKKKNPALATEMLDIITEAHIASKMLYPYCGIFQLDIENNDRLKTALHMAILEEQPLALIEEIKAFGICMTQRADICDLIHSVDLGVSQKWQKAINKIFAKKIQNEISLTATQLAALSERPDMFEMLTRDTEFNYISEFDFFKILSLDNKKKDYVDLFLSRVNKILNESQDLKFPAIKIENLNFDQVLNYPFALVDAPHKPVVLYLKAGLFITCYNSVFQLDNMLPTVRLRKSSDTYKLLSEKFHVTTAEILKINARSGSKKTDLVEKNLLNFEKIFSQRYIDFIHLCFKQGFLNKNSQILFKTKGDFISPLSLAMYLNSMPLIEIVLEYQDKITLNDLGYTKKSGLTAYRPFFDFLLNHDKTDDTLKSYIHDDINTQKKEQAEKAEQIRLAQEREKAANDAKRKEEADQLTKQAVGSASELSLSQSCTHTVSGMTYQYGSIYPDTSPSLTKPLLPEKKNKPRFWLKN